MARSWRRVQRLIRTGACSRWLGTSPPERDRSAIRESDGKILAAGHSFLGNLERLEFALVRYEADGTLDATFGGDGKVTTPFGGFDSETSVGGVGIQADGKIVAAGPSFFAFAPGLTLARYALDGTLDPTFGGDGRAVTTFARGVAGTDLVIQPDGRLVVAGMLFTTSGDRFVLTRYLAA